MRWILGPRRSGKTQEAIREASDSGQCLECGFYYWTKTRQLTLEELNDEREQRQEWL